MIVVATPEDSPQIHAINTSTDIFSEEETETVDEMLEEAFRDGFEKSGYQFIVYKEGDRVMGYACFGPHSLADQVYDLYWIAVDPKARGGGIGKKLLAGAEDQMRILGTRLIIVETSGLPEYESTRAFYRATHYNEEAVIKDFYKDGDDLYIYTKHL